MLNEVAKIFIMLAVLVGFAVLLVGLYFLTELPKLG